MLTIMENADQLAQSAAEEILNTVRAQPNAIIVLPTGNTPLPTYARLVEISQQQAIDWSGVRVVSLDEYSGIARDDPRVLCSWLERKIIGPLGIATDHFIRFEPADDPLTESARIEDWLGKNGPIDLAVLGLGLNGHLGFNEPGTAFTARAHSLTLTPESISSNATYWGGEDKVPRSALTLGIGTLMQSCRIMLMVSGQAKADILARSIEGAVGPEVPATALRSHPNLIILADGSAALALSRESLP